YDARENVDASGRALRVRLAAHTGRQREPLFERDEVRTLGLEHDTVLAQVELVDDELLDALVDGLLVGQEAALNAVRDLAETQVEAGRLDVLVGNREPIRVHDTRRDRLLEVLARQHATPVRRKLEYHGRIVFRGRPQSLQRTIRVGTRHNDGRE